MAVIGVDELPQRSGSVGSDFKRHYTRKFLVLTDARTDEAIQVRLGVDPFTGLVVPQLGWVYTNGSTSESTLYRDFGAFVTEVACQETERCVSGGSWWEVTVTYGPADPTAFEAQNPLDANPRVSWGLSRFSRVCESDVNGKAVVNSAGDYFDPPLEADDSRPMLTVTVNESEYDESLTEEYKDAVNSDSFWGYDPGAVKLMDRTGELQHSGDCPTNGGYYWEVKYEFEIRSEGWHKKPLDQGLKVLKSGQLVNATGEDGNPVSSPILLDGSGQALTDPSPDHAVFLDFEVYKSLPFDQFNLEQFGP